MDDKAEFVTIEETDDKMLAWEKFHFDVLFSGDDWKGSDPIWGSDPVAEGKKFYQIVLI